MNKLNPQARAQVISCLIEGCSIRSTVRITGVSKKCVMRLLVEVGEVCARHQDRVFRNLQCRRLQLDELWTFLYCKDKNVTPEIYAKNPNAGDIWLWTAIDADTKLVPPFVLGNRDARSAKAFIDDLAPRLAKRVQVTSDGLKCYVEAIEGAFGCEVDYAMLVKVYGAPRETEARYSPAECIGCQRQVITSDPNRKHISTSYVERQNWTVRTNIRRYTRLSNGFSRKITNHFAAVALNYFAYNFIKIHSTLRVSPAMAAGVTDRLWSVDGLVALWESEERRAERAA